MAGLVVVHDGVEEQVSALADLEPNVFSALTANSLLVGAGKLPHSVIWHQPTANFGLDTGLISGKVILGAAITGLLINVTPADGSVLVGVTQAPHAVATQTNGLNS